MALETHQGHVFGISAVGSHDFFRLFEVAEDSEDIIEEFHVTPEPTEAAEDDIYAQHITSRAGDCSILETQNYVDEDLAALDLELAIKQVEAYSSVVTRGWHNLLNASVNLLWYNDANSLETSSERLCELEATINPNGDYSTNTVIGSTWCAILKPKDGTTGEDGKGRRCCDPKNPLFIANFVVNESYHYVIDDSSDTVPDAWRIWWHGERYSAVEQYRRSNSGLIWLQGSESRPPPNLYMWDANKIGEIHNITTKYRHLNCVPPLDPPSEEAFDACLEDEKDSKAPTTNSSFSDLKLQLRVVTKEPRIFEIDNFLSEAESEHIIRLAAPYVSRSQVGCAELGDASFSVVRTSRNSWISRESSAVTEHIWKRAADLLRIDEARLTSTKNAEDLQVVHYIAGQKYDAHHDWGTDNGNHSRFATLLLYLNDVEAGGQTAFPRAHDHENKSLIIRPRKGGAVLFYNLLADGNADNLTLHAALPVLKGEKWLANFWIWDPLLADNLRGDDPETLVQNGE